MVFRKVHIFEATSVPMSALGLTTIGTVPSGQDFYPTQVRVTVRTPPSALGPFALTVGTNPPNHTNIAGSRFDTVRVRNPDDRMAVLDTTVALVPADTEIKLRVAATTTSGGVMDVAVTGFLVDAGSGPMGR